MSFTFFPKNVVFLLTLVINLMLFFSAKTANRLVVSLEVSPGVSVADIQKEASRQVVCNYCNKKGQIASNFFQQKRDIRSNDVSTSHTRQKKSLSSKGDNFSSD